MAKQISAEVVVLGGGPGGYAAAFMSADLGKQAVVVDPEENPGGVCLYRGCIPTKALLHLAKVKREARRAEDWGMRFGEPELDLDRVRQWKDQVVAKLTRGLGQLGKSRKVRHIRAMGRLKNSREIALSGREEDGTTLSFEHLVIATGARPVPLPGVSFDSDRVLDSKKALELADVPESLLVVGAGYIGLELSTVYAALGSRVTIVEMMPGIMPGADRDLIQVFEKSAGEQFEQIIVNTKAELEVSEKGVRSRFSSVAEGGSDHDAHFDKVLITVGRAPNTGDLGLENTAVQADDKGFIQVDEERRTGEPSIFAVGDVTGPPLLAHKASHQGRTAAEVIAGRKAAYEPRAVPSVEYTDPEIAWCGLTETGAREQGRDVTVAAFPWSASGRAATMGRSTGLTKLIVDPSSERILGVGMVGTGAGELISEGALALEMAARAADLGMTIHPHPTLSETLMEAAQAIYGESTHIRKRTR